jgi:hypothetical protein
LKVDQPKKVQNIKKAYQKPFSISAYQATTKKTVKQKKNIKVKLWVSCIKKSCIINCLFKKAVRAEKRKMIYLK